MESAEAKPQDLKLIEVDVKGLGDSKDAIAKIVESICKPLLQKPPKQIKEGEEQDEEEELDEEDDEVMSGIEQTMASDIKKKLDADLKGNWNTLVGNRFNSLLNLLAKDKHGIFKIGGTQTYIFEMNNY